MARKPSETSRALGEALAKRDLSQNRAATASNTSQAYFNQVMRGDRTASPSWLNIVAAGLNMSEPERATLQLAAVTDLGFDIDLIETVLPKKE